MDVRACVPVRVDGREPLQVIRAEVLNIRQRPVPGEELDIRLARDRGYIIADASGVKLGWDVAGTPGQRDPQAQVARDKDGRIIVPPGEPRKAREIKE